MYVVVSMFVSLSACMYVLLTACSFSGPLHFHRSHRYRDAELKHGRLAMVALAGWPLATLVLGLLTKVCTAVSRLLAVNQEQETGVERSTYVLRLVLTLFES